MALARPRAILFDMDGTIIDTERTAALALRECLKPFHITLSAEDGDAVTGRKWEFGIEILFDRYGPAFRAQGVTPESFLKTVVDHHRRHLESLPSLPAIPGAFAAVHALAKQLPVALVSGSQRREIEWAMGQGGVLDLFQFILGAEDYTRSKPAPDGYLAALKRLGVAPADALVFEDSEAGIGSGLAAGMTVVAVTYAGHAGRFAAQAHARIKDFTDPTWDDLGRALARL